jgi:hypothetical protein
MLALMTLIVIASSASTARAQYPDSVSITTPSGNPTWVAGNGESVAAVVYGDTPVPTMRDTIYSTGDSSNQYYIEYERL